MDEMLNDDLSSFESQYMIRGICILYFEVIINLCPTPIHGKNISGEEDYCNANTRVTIIGQ